MSANSAQPDKPQRMSFVCDCGKKLAASSTQSGKRLKCPSCGRVVVVPPVAAAVVPAPASSRAEPQKKKAGKRGLMFVVYALPVAFAIGGGALIRSDLQRKQLARSDAASTEARQAVVGTNGRPEQGGAKEGVISSDAAGGTDQSSAETASKADHADRSNDPSLTAADYWAVGQAVAGVAQGAWDRIQTAVNDRAVSKALDQGGRQEANRFESITAAIAASPSKVQVSMEKDPGRQFVSSPATGDLSSAGLFSMKKRSKADSPRRAAEGKDQAAAAGADEKLTQLIREINGGQGPGGFTKQAFQRREQAVDDLRALGPAAIDAVPALSRAALNDRDTYVKRRSIEILGEIGGLWGMRALGWTLLQPGNDPECARAAEDSLRKLLPAVGSGLRMNDAIFLYEVHRLGNKRVSPAIESAWAASGFTQDAIVKEINRPALERQASRQRALALAKEKENLERRWQACLATLPPEMQARANEAIANLNGTYEQDRRFKEWIMSLPPAWQREMLRPPAAPPDFWYWFRKVSAMDAEARAEEEKRMARFRNAERALPGAQR